MQYRGFLALALTCMIQSSIGRFAVVPSPLQYDSQVTDTSFPVTCTCACACAIQYSRAPSIPLSVSRASPRPVTTSQSGSAPGSTVCSQQSEHLSTPGPGPPASSPSPNEEGEGIGVNRIDRLPVSLSILSGLLTELSLNHPLSRPVCLAGVQLCGACTTSTTTSNLPVDFSTLDFHLRFLSSDIPQ